MKYFFTLYIILHCFTTAFPQPPAVRSEILSSEEIVKLFPDVVCKALNINFPIFSIYKYIDKTGENYCILTESSNEITPAKDTMHHQLKAINVKLINDSLVKGWEINDKILTDKDETSIWFWTKYIDFKEYDHDGLVTPIIIYGTSAANGYDDGRIKIIIYYKGRKIAIRHQNGVLDAERETQVDQTFYDLPKSIQKSIMQKMELMTKANEAIFPANWQTAMKNRKTAFNERN